MKIQYFKDVKTFDELKRAYRDLMKKYHPDLNPGKEKECTEIAKVINNEFEYLFKVLPNERVNAEGKTYEAHKEFKTPKQYMDIINQFIRFNNIQIDIIGSWIWISGDTKPIKEVLKEFNFKWHSVRLCWYLKFTTRKSELCNLNLDELQEKFGGERFNTNKENNKISSLAVSC